MYTTGYSDHQLLCNLSIKLNSILTYTALAINSYKIWELVYEKRLLFHRGNMVYPPPPAQIRTCMATQQPVIHMSPYRPYPTGLFPWPTLTTLCHVCWN